MGKKIPGLSIDGLSRISKPSIFDRLVKEIDTNEVPVKYIEHVVVTYIDGSILKLKGKEVAQTISTDNKKVTSKDLLNIKDIKIFLNTSLLEADIDILLEELIGKYC